MRRSLQAYLWDIAEAAANIQSFVYGLSFEDYLANGMVQAAVERKFEIIGEEIKQGSARFPEIQSLPEMSGFARFRDRLAHGYFDVSHTIVWQTIEDDLPSLLAQIHQLLPKKI